MNTTTSQLSVRPVTDENDTAHFIPGFSGAAAWFSPGALSDDEAVIKRQISSSTIVNSPLRTSTFAVCLLPVLALLTASLVSCSKKDPDPGGPDSEPNADQFTTTWPATESANDGNLPLYCRHGFLQIGEIHSGSSPVLYQLLQDPQ